MRTVGPLLVAFALACSPHGTRVERTAPLGADSSAPAAAPLCQEPLPQTPTPDLAEVLRGAPPGSGRVVPLNTSGYNYNLEARPSLPGSPPPPAPTGTGR